MSSVFSKVPEGFKLTAAAVKKFIQSRPGFEFKTLEKINITSLENGRCIAELKVEEEHTNPMGGLHGGLSSTLVDSISSYALSSAGPLKHVSVDLHIKFLKGAVVGDTIVIDSKVTKAGKTLAFLDVEIKNKETGQLLVQGSHTKFIMHD